MKKCRDCNTELIVGETISPSRYKQGCNRCKKCLSLYRKKQAEKQYNKHLTQGTLPKCRKCNIELIVGKNITLPRAKNGDWQCKKCNNKAGNTNAKKRYQKLRAKSQAGVYGCYLDGELVYVGESQYCELRWYRHINTHPNTKDYIGLDLTRRHEYEWRILELEENEWRRKVKEIELIVEHKPRLNSPYRQVLALDNDI